MEWLSGLIALPLPPPGGGGGGGGVARIAAGLIPLPLPPLGVARIAAGLIPLICHLSERTRMLEGEKKKVRCVEGEWFCGCVEWLDFTGYYAHKHTTHTHTHPHTHHTHTHTHAHTHTQTHTRTHTHAHDLGFSLQHPPPLNLQSHHHQVCGTGQILAHCPGYHSSWYSLPSR